MRDTLDLDQLTRQGDEIHRAAQRRTRRALIFLVLSIILIVALRLPFGNRLGTLYVIQGNTPQVIDNPITDSPFQAIASDDGSIWVVSCCGELYHYAAGKWADYGRQELGTGEYGIQALATNGAEAWAVVGRNVVHYDGARWTTYPNVLPSEDTYSIAAGSWGVYAIDVDGNMTWFDGKDWANGVARNILPVFEGEPASFYPSVLKAPDGGLLLAYDGIWQFDGRTWTQVFAAPEDQSPDMEMLAADGDLVWFGGFDGVATFNLASRQWQPYDSNVTGIPRSGRVNSIAAHHGIAYVSTRTGLFRFDGKMWNAIKGLAVDNSRIGSPALDSGGALWAPVYSENVYDRPFMILHSLANIVIVCNPLLVIIILLASWYIPTAQANVTQAAAARTILQEALPGLPRYAALTANKSRYRVRLWVQILVGMILGVGLGLAGVSFGLSVLIIAVAMILASAGPILLRMIRTPDAQERGYFKRLSFLVIIYTVLLILCFGLVMMLVAPILFSLIQEPILAGLLFLLITGVLGFGLFYVIQIIPTLLIYHHILAYGDYDRAITRTNRYLAIFPRHISFLFLRGFIELLAARYDAAEKTWNDTLTEAQNGNSIFIGAGLLNLGCALDGLNRHEEALPLFMAAIRVRPQYGHAYEGLVSHYNDLDIEPERTLELSRIVLRYVKKPRTNLLLGLYNWSLLCAEHALALARMGQYEEADATMARAFKEADLHFQPGAAMLHVIAGRIALLKNDLPAVREAFNAAIERDPNGEAGIKARRFLAQA